MTDEEIWATYKDNIQYSGAGVDGRIVYPEQLDEILEKFFGTVLSDAVIYALSDYIYDNAETYSVPYTVNED